MTEIMNLANTQMTSLPAAVQFWMNWMFIIFLMSLIFVGKKIAARYTIGCFLLTMPIGMIVFYFTKTVHLLGIAHLILWTPLAYYLYKIEMKKKDFQMKTFYGVWVMLVILTIVISLGFDIRDIALVMLGQK